MNDKLLSILSELSEAELRELRKKINSLIFSIENERS
jgi:hypothetical protein